MGTRQKAAGIVLVGSMAIAMLPGFAASLGGLTGKKLGAGSSTVAACDTNGFSVSYTTSAGAVTNATVGAIADPGCEGGQLSLVLANSSGTSVGAGSGTVPTDGDATDNSLSVAISPQPAASVVTAVHISVVGP
jgi:hypothetical protein